MNRMSIEDVLFDNYKLTLNATNGDYNSVTNAVTSSDGNSIMSVRVSSVVVNPSKQRMVRRFVGRENAVVSVFFSDSDTPSGIYIMRNATVTERGGNTGVVFKASLIGPFQRRGLSVSAKQFDLYFDGYEEDFHGETLSTLEAKGWSFTESSAWSVSGNRLYYDGSLGIANYTIWATYTSLCASDYSVQADFSNPTDGSYRFYAVGFRFIDYDESTQDHRPDGYLVRYYRHTNDVSSYIALYQTTSGTDYTLRLIYGDDFYEKYGVKINYPNNDSFTLKASISGNEIKVYLDDLYIKELTCKITTTYTAGYPAVGVRSLYNNVYIDNFKVTLNTPLALRTPVEAVNFNQSRMDPLLRHRFDEIVDGGRSQLMVEPVNPVLFQSVPVEHDDRLILNLQFLNRSGNHGNDSAGDNSYTYLSTPQSDDVINNRFYPAFYNCGFTENKTYPSDGYSYELLSPTKTMSVEVWYKLVRIKPGEGLPSTNYAMIYDFSGTFKPYYARIDGTDRILFSIYDGSSWHSVSYYPSTHEYGVWHHLTITLDGGTGGDGLKMYYDGVLVGESAYGIDYIPTSNSYLIHRYSSLSVTGLRVYDKVLTEKEIAEKYATFGLNKKTSEIIVYDTNGEDGLYSHTTAHFKFDENYGYTTNYSVSDHVRGVEGHLVGLVLPKWTEDSYCPHANTCLYFNGDSSHVMFGGSDVSFKWGVGYTEQMSFGVWAKVESTDTSGAIISRPWNGSGEYNYSFRIYSSTQFALYLQVSISTQTFYFDRPLDDQWHHYFFVMDAAGNKTVKIFVDGKAVVDTTHNVTAWVPPHGDSNYSVAIGTLFPYGGSWSGNTGHAVECYLDDVMFYDTIVSDERVAWLYENMPRVVMEEKWERVYDARHKFVGEMVIDNGVIRLTKGYRGITDARKMIGLAEFRENIWNENPYLFVEISHHSKWLEHGELKSFNIRSWDKHGMILRAVHQIEEGYFTVDYHVSYARPTVTMEIVKVSGLVTDVSIGIKYLCGDVTDKKIMAEHPRFTFVAGDVDAFGDGKLLSTGALGSNEELPIIINVDKGKGLLSFMSADENTDGWRSYFNAGWDGLYLSYVTDLLDYDTGTTPKTFVAGLIPNDRLFTHYECEEMTAINSAYATTYYEGSGSRGVDQTVDCMYITGSGTQGVYQYVGYRPPGLYKVFVRAKAGSAYDANFKVQFYDADSSTVVVESKLQFLAKTLSFDWYEFDLIMPTNKHTTDVQFRIIRSPGDGSARVQYWDEVVIVPFSNAKNYPLDEVQRAYKYPLIKEFAKD